MLDIRLIRENPDYVKQRLATRGGALHLQVDAVLEIDAARRRRETELQRLQGDRKRISKDIGAKKAKGEDTSEIEAHVRTIGEEISELNREATESENAQRTMLLGIPNLPHDAAPLGHDASQNPVVKIWGEKPQIANPLDHVKLGEKLGLFDLERAAKISGSGFVCYTGQGARLLRALVNYCLDLHTREHGYIEMSPPLLVRADALEGTTQLPKFRDQLYHCAEDDVFLVPTAEVPVTNFHREEILAPADLPKRYVAYTPCFRREAGAAGIGTRGIIRVHQFDKIELVKIVEPENSFAELDALTADAERVLQTLGLHYQIIELCTGDIGFGAAKTYDIEVWAPGQNAYLEVSSCSNFTDYQARRMDLKFKDAEGKNRYCHTLNGSGTAIPRLYVALLETYQPTQATSWTSPWNTAELSTLYFPLLWLDLVIFSPRHLDSAFDLLAVFSPDFRKLPPSSTAASMLPLGFLEIRHVVYLTSGGPIPLRRSGYSRHSLPVKFVNSNPNERDD